MTEQIPAPAEASAPPVERTSPQSWAQPTRVRVGAALLASVLAVMAQCWKLGTRTWFVDEIAYLRWAPATGVFLGAAAASKLPGGLVACPVVGLVVVAGYPLIVREYLPEATVSSNATPAGTTPSVIMLDPVVTDRVPAPALEARARDLGFAPVRVDRLRDWVDPDQVDPSAVGTPVNR